MQLGTNSFEWVVSNGTCPTERDTVNVVVDENPIADAGPDLATRDIEPVQIQAKATNAQTINWTPFSSLVDETVEQPIANPQENTVYRMDVTSPEGCTAFDEMEITVTIETNLDATPLFSPNGDGRNDTWVVNKPEMVQRYIQHRTITMSGMGRLVELNCLREPIITFSIALTEETSVVQ